MARDPSPAESPFPEGRILRLPRDSCRGIIHGTLMTDPKFKTFFEHFSGQGMKFIPERAIGIVYVRQSDSWTKSGTSPALLTVVPSFRPFPQDSSCHEAVSIVTIQYGDQIGNTTASHVVVGHRPYRILSFTAFEINGGGRMLQRRYEREDLERMSIEQAARMMGPPDLDQSSIKALPALSESDMSRLASEFYRELILDPFAKPLYPSDGLESLLLDAPLVSKFSMVESARASMLLGSLSGSCSSSSTSSNACSSTSCSWNWLKLKREEESGPRSTT